MNAKEWEQQHKYKVLRSPGKSSDSRLEEGGGKCSQGELTLRRDIPSYRKKVKGILDGQGDLEKGIQTQKDVTYLGLS